ncbi:MAG: energy-coupling factor transporter transmembrane protein EcfT [Oscillospiraceae bacterium]|nr:energy-coupling factor transporter transmembrane protein EcfT [Oscillospiraceae bacterium]
MNNKLVINYIPGPTVLHKLTGFTKVLLFLVMTVAIIATYDIRILIPLLIINIIEIISMKPNYKPICTMFLITFVTVTLLGNVMLFIVSPDAGLNNVGANNVIWTSANGKFYLSKEFLWYMLAVFIKRTTSFASVMAFALATTPSEFASGLNKCGLPYKICTIVSLAYRTIPDIANDFINIRNSMMMRGVELSKKASVGKRLKNTVLILVPLIFTSFGKVSSIANAMDLRGYGKNKKRTWYAEHEQTKWDPVIRTLTVMLAVAAVYYIIRYRIIDPWPVNIWCPWLSRDEIVQTEKELFILNWFKKQ